jgi:pyruvate formate lyase activating enzyme
MDRFIYEEYTGVNHEKVMQNLFRIKAAVPADRLHIRIPNIPGFNTKEDVAKSVEWIKDVLGVEPEVFNYYALPHTVKEPDWLHDEEDEEE